MTTAMPVLVPKPPGKARRKRSWLRRRISSRLGGCGPRGPLGPCPLPRPPPQGPPPRGPVPQGPPPSLCQIIEPDPFRARSSKAAIGPRCRVRCRPRTPGAGCQPDRGRAERVLSSAGVAPKCRQPPPFHPPLAGRGRVGATWDQGMAVTEGQVLDALAAVRDPDRGADVVSLGMISGVVVRDGNVGFAIEVEPERGPRLEPLRKAAEQAVEALPGVVKPTLPS